MRRNTKLAVLAVLIPIILTFLPATTEAQRRGFGGHGGRGGRSVVVVGGFYGPFWSPYWGAYWDPFWYGPYGWYGYPMWGYYGQGYGYERGGKVRLQVEPKDTQVYVDGYFVGVVDDYDGVFQRLHVRTGEHELALYLKGYHTVRQSINLRDGQDYRLRHTMQPLAAGEASEPPPQPTASATEAQQPGPERRAAPRPYGAPRGRMGEPPRREPPVEQPGVEQAQGFGTLSIRVQPSGAEVLVDGDRWQGPEGQERLLIQVSEGTHRIEIRKEGYVTFTTEVRVRGGETAPLNVSLPPRGN